MRIRSLNFENFRQHRDLSLTLDSSDSDFVVIHGENGEGKTNLLNGILWCFYGNEGDSKDPGNKDNSLVSRAAQDELGEGQSISVRVSVGLEFSEGMTARVERTQIFQVGAKSSKPMGKSELSIVTATHSAAADAATVSNPEIWLDERFPERLRQYFLFDGEKLDSFFSTAGSVQTVEDAVLQITQVDVLTRMIERLEIVRAGYESEAGAKSSDTDIQAIQQILETLTVEESVIVEEIAELEKQAVEFAAEYQSIERDIEKLLEQTEDRRKYETALATAALQEENLSDLKLQHAIWAATQGYLNMLSGAVEKSVAFVARKRKAGEIPASIKPTAISELLMLEKCICGSALGADSSERKSLENLLARNKEIDEAGETILAFETSLQGAQALAKRLPADNANFSARIEELQSKVSESQDLVEQLKKKVSKLENGEERLQSLRTVQAAKDANADKLNDRRLNQSQKRTQIDEKRREFEKALSKDSSLKEISRQIHFVDELLHLARQIFEELSDEVREEAERVLDEEFKRMIGKSDYIASVAINEGFKVQVFDNRGFEILGTLSAGENACLAFAFALALNKISGFEMPMVIDTPLGRMSPNVQTDVARALARNTKNLKGAPPQQVILLMTGTEYNDEVRAAISDRNPQGYRLRFDVETSESHLEVVR
jgi:DNA sulfur modification protein DndD